MTRRAVLEMIKYVSEHLAMAHKEIKEGVGKAVRGKILDYEAKRIYKEGFEEGFKEGYKEGVEEVKRETIKCAIDFYSKKRGMEQEEIIRFLMGVYSLKREEAEEYIEKKLGTPVA